MHPYWQPYNYWPRSLITCHHHPTICYNALLLLEACLYIDSRINAQQTYSTVNVQYKLLPHQQSANSQLKPEWNKSYDFTTFFVFQMWCTIMYFCCISISIKLWKVSIACQNGGRSERDWFNCSSSLHKSVVGGSVFSEKEEDKTFLLKIPSKSK